MTPRLPVLVVVLVLAQLLGVAESYYWGQDTYSTTGFSAYTWGKGAPQSTVCQENSVSLSSCSLWKSTCACDVTAGVCDYGCCCDADCSSAQQSRFGSVGICPVSSSSNTVPLCYSSVELYKINPRLPLGGQPTAEAAVADALCVYKYNYATKGEYYTTAAVQDSVVFQRPTGQKAYSYGDVASTTVTIDGDFDKGDRVASFLIKSATTNLVPFQTGYFSLPAPDFSGRCNDNNYANFEQPVKPTKCNRVISDFSGTQCTNALSVARIKAQYVAKTASLRASSGSATTADAVQVTVKGIYYQNPITGAVSAELISTSVWSDANCAACVQGNVACPTCSITGRASLASASGANPICVNAVKQVEYVVTHAGDDVGTITAVDAYIVITDVPSTLAAYGFTSLASLEWSAANDGFVQTFGVEFNGAFTGAAVSSSAGNIVSRARSGNPGYIMGKPVLYGTMTGSASVITEQVAGLVVPSSLTNYGNPGATFPFTGGLSACPTMTAASTFSHVPLRFGYDVSTGCSVSLNYDALKSLCTSGGGSTAWATASSFVDANGFPYFFDFANGYIGSFGNADPLDSTQWIPINKRASSPTRAWSDASGTCTGVPSGLSYKFLVASAGEKAFPQKRIISAEVEVIYSNWVYGVSGSYGDTASTQSFPLTVTVSFVNTNHQQLAGYAPPAPPVLFKVPYDVFYPFYMSPAAPSSSFSPAVMLAVLVVGALLGGGWSRR